MNKNLLWMTGALWLAAASLMTGCSNDTLLPDEETNPAEQGECFTLYATNGSSDDSRLAFGEDGITLKWENGDQLMLVDVESKLDPIYLTTTLETPSATAAFRSESAVPAGRYYVKNIGRRGDNTNSHVGVTKTEWQMRFGGYNSGSEYSLGEGGLKNINTTIDGSGELYGLDKYIDLYSAPITIADAQTSASINLTHAYAMIKFELEGAESFLTSTLRIGAICPTKGFVMESQLNENTITPIQECFKVEFADGLSAGSASSDLNNLGNMGALLCPVDLSGHDVYFYVSHRQTERIYENGSKPNRDFIEATYEIVKEGKDLKAGVCYTIKLNLNDPNTRKIEINEAGELSEPEHFRALAYHYNDDRDSDVDYKVIDDIDFSGETVFPIYGSEYSWSNGIDGGGHTLKNITITDWPLDNVGLFVSRIDISDLSLENVNISSKNSFVGAFVGRAQGGVLTNCSLIGTNNISGKDYVGSISGGWNKDGINLNGCNVSEGTTVTGSGEIVGGLGGYIYSASNCKSAATVNGTNYVGGICGMSKSVISECTFTGTVEGKDYVGGILGSCYSPAAMYDNAGRATKCANLGTVKGENYVGGIVGAATTDNTNVFDLSYSTGAITGNTNVGGICGSEGKIVNCYVLSDVTGGSENENVAGIVGTAYNQVANCYFAGTVSSGVGICNVKANAVPENKVVNCITTATSLCSIAHTDDGDYANLSDIHAKVSYINGDKVYSESETDVWENNPKKCPKFLWQSPALDMGEGGGIKAPAFDSENW